MKKIYHLLWNSTESLMEILNFFNVKKFKETKHYNLLLKAHSATFKFLKILGSGLFYLRVQYY